MKSHHQTIGTMQQGDREEWAWLEINGRGVKLKLLFDGAFNVTQCSAIASAFACNKNGTIGMLEY
tara:strand:- start:292 stop:486 length:195 start_codon:yes stop_codon:yes gene_type:complete